MKRISTARMKRQAAKAKKWTIGIDLGDQSSRYCVLDEQGDVIAEGSVATTKTGPANFWMNGALRTRIAGYRTPPLSMMPARAST